MTALSLAICAFLSSIGIAIGSYKSAKLLSEYSNLASKISPLWHVLNMETSRTLCQLPCTCTRTLHTIIAHSLYTFHAFQHFTQFAGGGTITKPQTVSGRLIDKFSGAIPRAKIVLGMAPFLEMLPFPPFQKGNNHRQSAYFRFRFQVCHKWVDFDFPHKHSLNLKDIRLYYLPVLSRHHHKSSYHLQPQL